jgi:hypothetical protein
LEKALRLWRQHGPEEPADRPVSEITAACWTIGGTVKAPSSELVVGLVAMLMAGPAALVAAQEHTRVKTPAVPGEQAPPADPGQKNFGAPITRPGPGGQRPPVPPRRPEPKFGTVSLDEISMSDPFVYPDEKTRTYYLIGSGGRLYKSPDLKTWTGPHSVIDLTGTWMNGRFVAAPEIHHIGGKYYLAGTWNDHNHLIENIPRRYNVPTNQTQLLVADSPEGPYKPLVPEFDFCLGPGDWDIIDGTLYQEDGTTYMVFVHEWTQIIDGTIASMPLSKDLTRRTAEPTTLFRASEAPRKRAARAPSTTRWTEELLDPAGQRGRLLHPLRHLRLVELVAFADVEVARVLALAGAGRDGPQRRPAEEGDLHVAREGVDAQEPPPAFDAVERRVPLHGLAHVGHVPDDERVEPAPDIALPARHRGDVRLHRGVAVGLRDLRIAAGQECHRLCLRRTWPGFRACLQPGPGGRLACPAPA